MTLDKKIIGNWGGSLAVRINGLMASQTSGIAEGDKVELMYKKDCIIIKKAKREVK